MPIDTGLALERILERGDPWRTWRALRLQGEANGEMPAIPYQDDLGGFLGPSDAPSPGATGEGICHLILLGMGDSGPAVVAADWLSDMRTPALAWLDRPEDVPGWLDTPAGARVWATASAVAGLLGAGRDPGSRAIDLLRGEADALGRFTGGAYPTFAAAAAFWLSSGPTSEMAEWALRWAREADDEDWTPWEWATALTFWVAAGIPAEHLSVEAFVEALSEAAPAEGWTDDDGLTLRTIELMTVLGA